MFNPLTPSDQSAYPPVLALIAFPFFLCSTFTLFIGISERTANFAVHDSQWLIFITEIAMFSARYELDLQIRQTRFRS